MAYERPERPVATADDEDWFSKNGPSSTASSANYIAPTGAGGRYTYADVQKINQQLFGGKLGDITPWVGQTDAFANLSREPQAQAYAKEQATKPAATTGGKLDWAKPETWTKENINAYASSRGVTDPNFADYWLSKKDELFQRGQQLGDPNYAFKRLSMADDFGGERYGGASGGAPGTPGNQSFDYPSWDESFSFDKFQAPSGLTEENDPGFEARMKLGTDALQRSAAARGTVLDTGTLKDLQKFGQDYATNEYDKVYGRAANTYMTNYNTAADQYNKRYGQYVQGYQNAATTFGINFGVDQNLWSRAASESDTGFARQMSLADLGLRATAGSAQAGQSQSNQATELYTGQANAGAAGAIAGGNAYANGLGQLANYGTGYLYNRQQPRVSAGDW